MQNILKVNIHVQINAKHIYEKLGFKPTGRVEGDEKSDPIWGGLTYMKLDLK